MSFFDQISLRRLKNTKKNTNFDDEDSEFDFDFDLDTDNAMNEVVNNGWWTNDGRSMRVLYY